MLFQNCQSFGLSRVRCQHGLHPDLIELCCHQGLRNAGFVQSMQVICPEARFAGQSDFRFARSANLSRDIFLDHIQELERD